MVETLVAFPVLLVLLFGVFELIMAYRAYLTFEHAVQDAARLAALNNGQHQAMRRGLIRGVAPLYTSILGDRNTALSAGFSRATAEVDQYMLVRRINPPESAFSVSEHGLREDRRVGDEKRKVTLIPSDRLMFRDSEEKGEAGLSIQDANVLKIEVQWCYPLLVPLLDRLLPEIIQPFPYQAGGDKGVCDEPNGQMRRGIAIRTDGLTRMQSDTFKRCNEKEQLRDCALKGETRHRLL